MPFHVRPLGQAEVVFPTYSIAKASADVYAQTGTQASVFEVEEDGSEVLRIICCRRTPIDQSLGETPPPPGAVGPDYSPQKTGTRPMFVFVDPLRKK